MKKMMFILMIMTAFVAGTALAVAPDDVTNPSFEDNTGGVCDFWTLYFGGGAVEAIYHDGDGANANSGDAYFEVGPNNGGWQGVHTALGEEIAVTPGEDFEMIFHAKTADGSAASASVSLKFEFYATQSEGWVEGSTPFADLTVDTGAGYQQYSLVATVPTGMNYARATVVSGGVAVFVDDVYVGLPGGYTGGPVASSPDPRNGSIQSVKNVPSYGYTPVTALSWSNPNPADDSTVGGAANLGVEVQWLNPVDPNIVLKSYSVAKGSGNAFESAALDTDLSVSLPLADDSDYLWKVIITDANSAGDQISEGNLWAFETGDALPIVESVVDQYLWDGMDDGIDSDDTTVTFVVTTTYTDDGKSPIVDANFTTGDWLWEDDLAGVLEVSDVHTPDAAGPLGAQSGTVVATYKTVALGDDPLRPTEETAFPGWWNIGLEVTDSGSRTTSGGTGYNYIGEDCGQAAAEGGDPDYVALVGAYDVNNDCVNNLVDFASLAAEWLDVSPKKE